MNPRLFVALALGEALVLIIYVVAVLTDADLSSLDVLLRVLVVVGAGVVAAATYQAWSGTPSTQSLAAMLAALLGGAALASTVVTAKGGAIYASNAVATVGTVALVSAVLVGQVAMARSSNAAGDQQ